LRMTKLTTFWCIISPKTLDDALEKAVQEGTYRTKSDLVRDAVRRRLEELGFFQKGVLNVN
jgi:metal-responsive CopG/Arc/MetJ family transcriptional regulator